MANGQQIDWSGRFTGSRPSPQSLIEASKKLLDGHGVSLVTIDMPLARGAITARREADNLVSKEFGGRSCGTHSPSPERPGRLSEYMRDGFVAQGFSLATAEEHQPSIPHLIEVYPHPALLSLLNIERRFEYKVGKARSFWPEFSKEARIQQLLDNFNLLLRNLKGEIVGINMTLPRPSDVKTLSSLRSWENALDALVCCWIGIKYLQGITQPFGNDTAAIWIPKPTRAGT